MIRAETSRDDSSRDDLPSVIWLASYPKSGNTWLRFVLSELLLGGVVRSEQIFEATPIDTCPIEALRRDRPNFVKTHLSFDNAPEAGIQVRGAILVVRDPFKVMVSNLRYSFLTGGGFPTSPAAFERGIRTYLFNFLTTGGDPRWQRLGFGTWASHAASWLEQDEIPVLLVRYEDMVSDMTAWTQRILDFANHPVERDEIERAAERWRFDRMCELEEQEIAAGTPGMFVRPGYEHAHRQGLRFVGSRGSPLEGLAVKATPAVASVFEPSYSILGYAPAS